MHDIVAYNASGESILDLNMQNHVVYCIADVESQMQSLNSLELSGNMNNEFTELDLYE